jgi:hypothetical protein
MKFVFLTACIIFATGCSHTPQSAREEKAASPEYFRPDPSTAAKLGGTIQFSGKKPPARRISMDAEEACEKLQAKPVYEALVSTGRTGGLADVFVYIKAGLEGKAFEPPKQAVMLDQRDCRYVPRVVALHTGQILRVRNSDPVSHNIHPVPQNNRDWNQQQPPGAPDLQRKFVRPEVMIPVKCNVHNWMRSYIGVLDHPYFAVTDTNGSFEWPSVPPGNYTVAAWHETLGELTESVSLTNGDDKKIALTFRQ